jgi:hypothetical protein
MPCDFVRSSKRLSVGACATTTGPFTPSRRAKSGSGRSSPARSQRPLSIAAEMIAARHRLREIERRKNTRSAYFAAVRAASPAASAGSGRQKADRLGAGGEPVRREHVRAIADLAAVEVEHDPLAHRLQRRQIPLARERGAEVE